MRHLDELIVAFVGNKISPEEKGDGQELWRMLKEKYVGCGVQAQGIVLDQFLELKFKNLDQWINDLQTTTKNIPLTGTDVNNALVTRLVIGTRPHKYESLIRLLTYGNQYPTIEEITISVEKDRALFQVKNEEKDKVGLTVDRGNHAPNFICYSCGKPGHIARHCQNKEKTKGYQERMAKAEDIKGEEEIIAFIAIESLKIKEEVLISKFEKIQFLTLEQVTTCLQEERDLVVLKQVMVACRLVKKV
ncbi:hypothetical protein O181_101195 [Austropuccinia psidii MF-1]|uniref:CCHC-type domain-containing protein n=1 Tax=Austropuccinia psidii MF-1 TaxID=1389203 RepID=A0A9Q3JE00_9BASI|nr:hypothetical protein [Austropuccinia psidii MF-1]